MNIALLIAGTGLLLCGAELLVRGASKLAIAVGISPLVVGLTVVAFGTSAPELAVSVASALKGDPAIAIGNVVGSNIFNILVIMAASAVVTPLAVSQQLIRVEIPLMIAASLATWGLAANGVIGRVEGGALFLALVIYTLWAVVQSRKETKATQEQYAQSLGTEANAGERKQFDIRVTATHLLCILAGLALLVAGSNFLVKGAVGIATAWGVSSAVIGLTIVAGGTSLPEVATSLMAAIRGEKDIAIGNVVGSNLFNLMCVLGGAAMVSPTGLAVAPSFLRLDFPIMVLVAAVCLPIVWTGQRVSRGKGILLLTAYGIYVAFLIRDL